MTRLIALVFALALIWVGVANARHACVEHTCDSAKVLASGDNHAQTSHEQSAKQDKAGNKLMCKFACHVQSLALTPSAVHVPVRLVLTEQPDFSPAPFLAQLSASPDQPPRTA